MFILRTINLFILVILVLAQLSLTQLIISNTVRNIYNISFYFVVNRTADNRSQLAEESGESGSDSDTNSMNVEGSDREGGIEGNEVYGDGESQSSQYTESDHEDAQ